MGVVGTKIVDQLVGLQEVSIPCEEPFCRLVKFAADRESASAHALPRKSLRIVPSAAQLLTLNNLVELVLQFPVPRVRSFLANHAVTFTLSVGGMGDPYDCAGVSRRAGSKVRSKSRSGCAVPRRAVQLGASGIIQHFLFIAFEPAEN